MLPILKRELEKQQKKPEMTASGSPGVRKKREQKIASFRAQKVDDGEGESLDSVEGRATGHVAIAGEEGKFTKKRENLPDVDREKSGSSR